MNNSAALLAKIPICMKEFLTTQDFAIVNGELASIAEQYHMPVAHLH